MSMNASDGSVSKNAIQPNIGRDFQSSQPVQPTKAILAADKETANTTMKTASSAHNQQPNVSSPIKRTTTMSLKEDKEGTSSVSVPSNIATYSTSNINSNTATNANDISNQKAARSLVMDVQYLGPSATSFSCTPVTAITNQTGVNQAKNTVPVHATQYNNNNLNITTKATTTAQTAPIHQSGYVHVYPPQCSNNNKSIKRKIYAMDIMQVPPFQPKRLITTKQYTIDHAVKMHKYYKILDQKPITSDELFRQQEKMYRQEQKRIKLQRKQLKEQQKKLKQQQKIVKQQQLQKIQQKQRLEEIKKGLKTNSNRSDSAIAAIASNINNLIPAVPHSKLTKRLPLWNTVLKQQPQGYRLEEKFKQMSNIISDFQVQLYIYKQQLEKQKVQKSNSSMALSSLNYFFFHCYEAHYTNNYQKNRLFQKISEFFLFVYERQQIWYKKRQFNIQQQQNRQQHLQYQQQRPHFTRDAILATTYFTNIYRELDDGTIYFRRHVLCNLHNAIFLDRLILLRDNDNHDQHEIYCQNNYYDYSIEVLWASIVYRLVNRVETFESMSMSIPRIDQYEVYRDEITALHRSLWTPSHNLIIGGDKKAVFTGAHSNMGFKTYMSTLNRLQRNYCQLLHDIMKDIFPSQEQQKKTTKCPLENCFKAIQYHIPSIDPYYSWQITCDLKECNVIDICSSSESNVDSSSEVASGGTGAKNGVDWVSLGPGAKVRRTKETVCLLF